ncbi:hypothetical protein SprV_0401536600 [Sparganum proliferum]
MVLNSFDKYDVVIKPSKIVFDVPSPELLGHHFDSEGFRPLLSKVEAIHGFPPPTSKLQLKRFRGMVNFCWWFPPNRADLVLSLTHMISGPKGPLELIGIALIAFKRINFSLADAILLPHPAPEALISLMVDASTVASSLCIPSMSQTISQTLHGLSHPGIQASQKLLADSFVWLRMNKDVEALARSCLSCQRNKVRRHSKFPPGIVTSPDARFSHVHLDVVGPLPPSNDYTHLLTCVDRYTCLAEAIP